MAWRWAAASKIGTSHIRSGQRLQDAYTVSSVGAVSVFAVVADGAGSAQFGAFGAWLVCRSLTVRLRDHLRVESQLPSEANLIDWIDELRDRISLIADRRNSTPRQFASTLAALVVSPDEVMTLQVGDSAVVGRRNDAWEVLCWPENGEYASTTYFVTDDPEPRLKISRFQSNFNAFSLFSDGVGDLALSHLEHEAHSRFFDPMMRPIDSATGTGRLSDLSAKLSSYLDSPSVCERTDDDKTLILISGG